MKKICLFCKWYHPDAGVCTNSDSEHCADFVGETTSCKEWEEEWE